MPNPFAVMDVINAANLTSADLQDFVRFVAKKKPSRKTAVETALDSHSYADQEQAAELELQAILHEERLKARRGMQRTRPPSATRLARGQEILRRVGAGKLTKNVVLQIAKDCHDWPEVQRYHRDRENHHRYEVLRLALHDLIKAVRRSRK
jgi:hypothetical protein